jgi:glycosyltransferase involved in cell wall biosynthesis
MTVLISAQNIQEQRSGMSVFLRRYQRESKDSTCVIKREHMRKPYYMNGNEVSNLKSELKQLSPSEAHIHSVLDASLFHGLIDILLQLKIPTTYHCHSLIEEQIEHTDQDLRTSLRAQKELFEKCSKIIFFSNYHKRRTLKSFPNIKDKSEVQLPTIKMGVRGQKMKNNVILYVGRLSEEKGVVDLAKAFTQVSGKKLIIVGDGPLLNHVKEILRATNHSIMGWIDNEAELSTFYTLADVVVIPSHYDTHNLVAQEALAHGTSVLMSDIPVFRELYIGKPLVSSYKYRNINQLSRMISLL